MKQAEMKKPQLSLKLLKAEMDEKHEAIMRVLEKMAASSTSEAPLVGSMHREEPKVEEPKAPGASYKFMFKARMFKSHGSGRDQVSRLQQLLVGSKRIEVNPITHEYKLTEAVIADFGEEGPGPPGFWGTDDEEMAKLMRGKMVEKKKLLRIPDNVPGDIEEIDVSGP